MRGGMPGEGVRDLVQERLVDLVVVEARGQIARDGDALAAVVAEPGATLRMVEVEAPRVVEVHVDQRLCPDSHAVQIGHEIRVKPSADIGLRFDGLSEPGRTGLRICPQTSASAPSALRRSAASMARSACSSSASSAPASRRRNRERLKLSRACSKSRAS